MVGHDDPILLPTQIVEEHVYVGFPALPLVDIAQIGRIAFARRAAGDDHRDAAPPLDEHVGDPPDRGHPLHKQRQRLASKRRDDGILAGGVRHRKHVIDVAGRDVFVDLNVEVGER